MCLVAPEFFSGLVYLHLKFSLAKSRIFLLKFATGTDQNILLSLDHIIFNAGFQIKISTDCKAI